MSQCPIRRKIRDKEQAWRTLNVYQGCHWTFAKITENLRARAVSQKMKHKKRQKVQKEKDEIGENREY